MNCEYREIPEPYDVVVSGGGTAGAVAAIAAARQGKSVLLLENHGFLGGMATGGMVSQFMGFADGVNSENVTGIMKDILDRLYALGAVSRIETIYLLYRKDLNVSAAAYDAEALKQVLDALVLEAGVDILFHTKVVGAEREGRSVKRLLIHNNDGMQYVSGKVYIDATFHGSVARDAGCEWVLGDKDGKVQPGSLMFRLMNVELDKFDALSAEEKEALGEKGVAEGALFTTAVLCRPVYDGLSYCNMSRVQVDATNPRDWSRAEMDGRAQVQKLLPFLIKNIPGFEKAKLAGTGAYLGLRDSRRILGQHYLKAEEILSSTRFEDYVAVSAYPIDIHDATGSESVIQKPDEGNYYIPWRCMVGPVDNLIVTGRCISADHEAHAAIRVMATCIQLGEAAGVGAAKSIDACVVPNQLDGTIVTEALFIYS